MNATDNQELPIVLRLALAEVALAYANICVEYSLNPSEENKEAKQTAKFMFFDIVADCANAVAELHHLSA